MGGKDALIGYVGRIPAPVRTKLLAAFLPIELLLVALGAIGLLTLCEKWNSARRSTKPRNWEATCATAFELYWQLRDPFG